MSYYKVTYDKLFPYAPYLNERIGMEILVESSQDPMDALEECWKIVHDFRNKHIQEELAHQYEPAIEPVLPTIEREKLEADVISVWAKDIERCKTLTELITWKFVASAYPELQKIYDQKYEAFENERREPSDR